MTKFLARWWIDTSRLPATPKEAAVLRLKMLEKLKAALSAGTIIDWGQFGNGLAGYLIAEGSKEDLYTFLFPFMPVVTAKILPVLDADQSINIMKKFARA